MKQSILSKGLNIFFTVVILMSAVFVVSPQQTSAATTETADIGMPFAGKWAYNVAAVAPWNDNVKDSHPAAVNSGLQIFMPMVLTFTQVS